MKISLNWLTDYMDVSMPAADLAGLLTRIGFCVEDVEETEADIIFDVEVTTNRPDGLGHIGIAREVAAVTGQPLRPPDLTGVPTTGRVDEQTAVEVLDPVFCPRYTARLIRGVKVGASPAWMVQRLEAVGLRAVNNVVDATNYVLMEYSQPLHAFDLDGLAGRRIVVRLAGDGELITAIDGSKHELRDWMGIIADADRPVAVAGIMGGLDTEVSEATTNVLIESAQFDALTVRRTSRALGLMSESSYRFERGVDPVALERASLRACQLILAAGGGQLQDGVVDVWAGPYEAPKVSLRPERCHLLLGIDVPPVRQEAILKVLGLEPVATADRIVCTIPPHRPDLRREVDLIEEVGRIHGFDKIPAAEAVTHQVTPPARAELARRSAGEVLNAAGYDEAVTFTFIDQAEAELFGWSNSLAVDPRLRKTNGTLRQGLLPSLLRARKVNQDAGAEDVRLFELASVFPPSEPARAGDVLPAEYTQLGLLTDGTVQDVHGAVEAVVRRFDAGAAVEVRAADVPGFAPGGAAELYLAPPGAPAEKLGVMGSMSRDVCDHYDLLNVPAGAMMDFDRLMALGQAVRIYTPVPRFPAIRRDLSVAVAEAVTWQAMAQTVAAAGGELLTDVQYVATYRGKQVGRGLKSVTMRLTYRHADRTLRHEEVDTAVEAVLEELKSKHAAQLRA